MLLRHGATSRSRRVETWHEVLLALAGLLSCNQSFRERPLEVPGRTKPRVEFSVAKSWNSHGIWTGESWSRTSRFKFLRKACACPSQGAALWCWTQLQTEAARSLSSEVGIRAVPSEKPQGAFRLHALIPGRLESQHLSVSTAVSLGRDSREVYAECCSSPPQPISVTKCSKR